jgi:general secretion pathway protein G
MDRGIVTGRAVNGMTSERGWTLVEMLLAVTIAGILATLAEPTFREAIVKAREAALKQNLFTLRDVIDQYRADRGKYPASLAELQTAGYLRKVPADPFTQSEATWQVEAERRGSGIFDVHSASESVGTNGIPYNQW